ncbi:MAG TPA: universal stress protein [Terracidiphilus sp.]|nr:universal stress protein [Terracidiphilus sp.]
MGLIENVLFPVDFSPSSIGMAAYVRRAAAMFGAKVSLIHVVDPAGYSGLELYTRSPFEIAEEHLAVGRERLDSFLTAEFPAAECPRILSSGDAATEIARTAREGKFDLIIMPTHAGAFRRMLLGSTTAKVLDSAACPVLTSRHAETIEPRPIEHREWLCAIGISANSARVLRFAKEATAEAHARITILHAVQSAEKNLPVQLDLEEQLQSAERRAAAERIAELEHQVGLEAHVRIAVGPVKEALLQAARQSDADVLMIGRNPHPAATGRLRDLTYAVVRDSPFPVLSI